jgi:hypothetical protein
VAHAAGVQLDGRDAGGFLDFDGIYVRVDIGLHYGHAKLVFEQADGLDEGGGFAAARGGHEVQEKHPLGFELFS